LGTGFSGEARVRIEPGGYTKYRKECCGQADLLGPAGKGRLAGGGWKYRGGGFATAEKKRGVPREKKKGRETTREATRSKTGKLSFLDHDPALGRGEVRGWFVNRKGGGSEGKAGERHHMSSKITIEK